MKELQQILCGIDQMAPGERAILATVVDVKGSGYRLAGARMLIDEDCKTIGGVSGGCLEADLIERTKSVFNDRQPVLVTYDTTKSADSVFGLQTGCRGVVRILLEPVANNGLFQFIRTCFERRETGVVATLIFASDESIFPLASRSFWLGNEKFSNYTDDGELRTVLPRLRYDAAAALAEGRSHSVTYQTLDGDSEFFIEVIKPPTSILIFGAGNDAPPLCEFAKQLGWHVSVIDHRPAFAAKERFPDVDQVIHSRVADLPNDVFADEESVAVVMSHNFEVDREALNRLLSSSCSYVGVLGPKQRTANLLEQLVADGAKVNKTMLSRLHAPVGLDIGGTTPEGIALSIVAEIQAVLADRKGGYLKDRIKPIYDR
jgi:xanthine dehydrogenase accessory factor